MNARTRQLLRAVGAIAATALAAPYGLALPPPLTPLGSSSHSTAAHGLAAIGGPANEPRSRGSPTAFPLVPAGSALRPTAANHSSAARANSRGALGPSITRLMPFASNVEAPIDARARPTTTAAAGAGPQAARPTSSASAKPIAKPTGAVSVSAGKPAAAPGAISDRFPATHKPGAPAATTSRGPRKGHTQISQAAQGAASRF